MKEFKCICGGTARYTTTLKDKYIINKIYCPKCKLIMITPEYDKNDVELKRRWQKIMEPTLSCNAKKHTVALKVMRNYQINTMKWEDYK